MKKVLTVIGARPQFIKAAIVSKELKKINNLEEIIIHTGQHFDSNMSEVFFKELNIPTPGYILDINNCGHSEMTGRMLIELDKIFDAEEPDGVLVYGDTNSTLAAALVAAKRHVPLFHVEAGLRSYNKNMPEEINRVLTDHVSSTLFTPCDNASKTLLGEGINEDNIVFSGDVMLDLFAQLKSEIDSTEIDTPDEYVACTIHRQENTDDMQRLSDIFTKLDELNEQIKVLMPLHPRTKAKLKEFDIKTNVEFLEPKSYIDMMRLLSGSKFVVTDSGGLQKEAFFNDKICITIRDETEWTELVDANWNFLFNSGKGKKLIEVYQALENTKVENVAPYGNGNASEIIASHISEYVRKN